MPAVEPEDVDFTDPKQVEAYMDLVFRTYSYQCYDNKDKDGCARLAEFVSKFKGDWKTAAELHEYNCAERKYGFSCRQIGGMYISGRGVDRIDHSLAFKYFLIGCESGNNVSCYNVGHYSLQGKETYNFDRALKAYEKGCNGNLPESCIAAMSLYFKGKPPELEKNYDKAFEIAKYGCHEVSSPRCCSQLYFMYRNGIGVEKSYEMARKYRELMTEYGPQKQ